jgi:hypothetical protein
MPAMLSSPRGVINPVAWFHIIGIDVREPAHTTADNILEVFTVLIQKYEVFLMKKCRISRYNRGSQRTRTCSFGISETAKGLLGCTLGEVTEGHPFWFQRSSVVTDHYKKIASIFITYLVEIHLLAVAMVNEPVQVIENQRPGVVSYRILSIEVMPRRYKQKKLPVDAFCEKNGNMWMLMESIASKTSWAPPRS